MPYLVFARKWRPKSFDEVVGQDDIIKRLKNTITANRLAHAYLFAGPRGVGKTSTARIFAKALNCQKGPTLNPCNKCPSCNDITDSRSLDVVEIDGASTTGVDNIRDLRENVKFSPALGKYKIYIIDEVHMLSDAAFNALLKTLEEPPEHVKFIFATTQPHKLPATILSRCHRFDFQHIPLLKIISQLSTIVKSEGITINEDVLFSIAKAADGSMRDAESVLDQLVAFNKSDIRINDLMAILGVVDQDYLFKITDAVINKDPIGALRLFDELVRKGKDISNFTNNLVEHFRNLMIAKITSDKKDKLFDLPEDVCDRIIKQAEAFSLDEVFSVFNILRQAKDMSGRVDFVRLPLEIALVKLTQKKDLKSNPVINQHLKQYSENKNVVKEPPSEKPQKNPEPDNTGADLARQSYDYSKVLTQEPNLADNQKQELISLDVVKNIWVSLIENVVKAKVYLGHCLEEGVPLKISNNNLTISLPANCIFNKESLEKKENKAIIEKTFCDLLNSQVRINFIINKDQKPVERKEQIEPLAKSALDTFNGKIIS